MTPKARFWAVYLVTVLQFDIIWIDHNLNGSVFIFGALASALFAFMVVAE